MAELFEYKPPENLGKILDEGTKAFMKKHMMETSRKATHVPKYLYHATSAANVESIILNGLIAHDVYGEVYLCEKEKQATKFIKPPCVVFKVDTATLDESLIFFSDDHVKLSTRNFETFAYYADIPPTAIRNWRLHR